MMVMNIIQLCIRNQCTDGLYGKLGRIHQDNKGIGETYRTATKAMIREANRRLKGPFSKFLGQMSPIKMGSP